MISIGTPRRTRPRLRTAALVALAVVAAGCAGSSSAGDGPAPPSTGTTPTDFGATTSTTGATMTSTPPAGPTLRGVRYCEILTVTPGPDGSATAEVWNTMGLNDCPQDVWDAVDLDDVKAQTGAAMAATNGPRYWVLDRIVPGKMAGSLQVKTFGGIEMRSIALVELPSLTVQTPYTEISVRRDTTFTYAAGREVYELTAPDESIYIMQSYSLQIDPTQTEADLASLGNRLELPDGWTFTARVLAEDLDVTTLDGLATVITDDLRNTYQLRSRG